MQTQPLTQVVYRPDALEQELDREMVTIRQDVGADAQTTGRRNLPHPDRDTLSFYWESFHYRFAQLIDRVDGELSFESVCYQVFEAQKETETRIRDAENALGDARKHAIALEGQRKQAEARRGPRKPWWLLPAVIVISLLEGTGMLPVWEVMGFNLIVSAAYSFLFAGFMALLSHLYPGMLELIKNRRLKWIVTVIFLGAMLFVFKEAGDIRTGYLRETTDTHAFNEASASVSPWLFAVLSTLFLVVSIALCYFFYPRKTKEQRDAEIRFHEICKAQRKNQKEIAQLEQGITDARNALRVMKEEAGAIITRGCYLENRIVSAAHEAYSTYKQKNLLYRTDGRKPDCFDESYPFDFTLKFHSIFQQFSHEKPL